MARRIHSRLIITGQLIAQTPLHVGGFGSSPDTDLPLALNGKNDFYVPGTSLAGVLRAWCEQNFQGLKIQSGRLLVADLFGPKREKGIDEGHASFVLVEDAIVTLPAQLSEEIRDGVGINRYYGTAAEQVKFDRAILPRGTTLDFKMIVEVAARREDEPGNIQQPTEDFFNRRVAQTKTVFGYLLEALTKSNVRFGAARTRGLGRVKFQREKVEEQTLFGFNDILNLFSKGGTDRSIAELKNSDPDTKPDEQPRLDITIDWHPRLPVMVKAGYDGIGVDMLPLTSGVKDGKLALCLPGSSTKGALRSHAERIVRTVLGSESETDFHDQIEVELVNDLFGARNKSSDNTVGKSEVRLGRGALAIDDCYAKEEMDATAWRKVEIAADHALKKEDRDKEVSYDQRELWQALKQASKESDIKADTNKFKIHHHVAIDRWTGGASEGALYSVLAPAPTIKWQPLKLTLDFKRLPTDPANPKALPALMLLLLTLRDMAENRLPLGFATNRGMGEIEVKAICLEGTGLKNELSCLNTSAEDGLILSEGKFSALDATLKETLRKAWETWRIQNQKA